MVERRGCYGCCVVIPGAVFESMSPGIEAKPKLKKLKQKAFKACCFESRFVREPVTHRHEDASDLWNVAQGGVVRK